MRIRIILDQTVLTATLENTAATRDLWAMLPLTLPLEDHAGTEKIAYLPRPLSLVDAPSGSDPSAGDIAFYAPWGNLALFYRDFGYSRGLVPLGKFEGDVAALRATGAAHATIEQISQY